METKLETIGDFVYLISRNNRDCVNWIGRLDQLRSKEDWQSFISLPFNSDTVIELAHLIARKVYCKAREWSEKRPHNKTLNWGHSFLRSVHRQAIENGIDVELSKIDPPIFNGD